MTYLILAAGSVLALAYAILHDSNTRRARRRAAEQQSVQQRPTSRPGPGPDSRLPADGFTIWR